MTRARKDLLKARVALTNQLLANLQLVLPGAVGLFSRLGSPISLAWLRRFTTQKQTDWLSPKRFDACCAGRATAATRPAPNCASGSSTPLVGSPGSRPTPERS